MRIMGVDPGTLISGYGVIDNLRNEMTLVTYGAIVCKTHSPMGERLLKIYQELRRVMLEYRPAAMAIETPFVGDNVKSALAVGKAQAIALLVAAEQDIPCYEYSPASVKQNVSDFGASNKEQMQKMVKLLLNLDDLPEPYDAADALAVAICHIRESHLFEFIDENAV